MRKFLGGVLVVVASAALTVGYFSWSARDQVVTTDLATEFFDEVLADPAARAELVDEAVEELLADSDRKLLIEGALGEDSEAIVRTLVDRAYDTPEFRSELDAATARTLSDEGGANLSFDGRPAFDAVVSDALTPAQAAALAELPDSVFQVENEIDAGDAQGWASIRAGLRSVFLVATLVGVASLVASLILFRSAGPLAATAWIMTLFATLIFAITRAISGEIVEGAADDGNIERILIGQIVERLQGITRLFLVLTIAAAAIHVISGAVRNLLKRGQPTGGSTIGTADSITDWSDTSISASSPTTQTMEANWPKIID